MTQEQIENNNKESDITILIPENIHKETLPESAVNDSDDCSNTNINSRIPIQNKEDKRTLTVIHPKKLICWKSELQVIISTIRGESIVTEKRRIFLTPLGAIFQVFLWYILCGSLFIIFYHSYAKYASVPGGRKWSFVLIPTKVNLWCLGLLLMGSTMAFIFFMSFTGHTTLICIYTMLCSLIYPYVLLIVYGSVSDISNKYELKTFIMANILSLASALSIRKTVEKGPFIRISRSTLQLFSNIWPALSIFILTFFYSLLHLFEF
ncbi:hypothetical protein NEOKW01_0576 [Nematocida sp. AWRm80]|nr:hypothetical protein NEOKW01_0576 [Nematocida sp. AWRm80]